MVGASGAIAGVLGSYLILFPGARIKTIIPIFFYITVASIPAFVFLPYWFVIQVLSGVATFSTSPTAGGVAFWAHAGGFLAGIFFALLFRKKVQSQKPYIDVEAEEY
jgi:hypothetical protein